MAKTRRKNLCWLLINKTLYLARKTLGKRPIFTVSLVIIVFLMVIFPNPTWSVNSTDELYIFGDSLSDVGNVFKLTDQQRPLSPPYYSGRYSNGRLWVEYLAEQLQLSLKQVTNLAWGGATTKGDLGNIPGLLTQVKNFASTHQDINSRALCVIWIGANDYLSGTTNVTATVENVVEAIFVLIQTGVKNFLIANLPDLGELPATRNTDASSSLSALTKSHNLYLSKSLQRLEQELDSNLKIVEFDVYSLYKEVIDNPDKFGLNNISDSCLKELSVCKHPDKFLFWDDIHPTRVAHQILGKTAFSKIDRANALMTREKSSCLRSHFMLNFS